jgi:hypothetical protein
MAIPFPGNGAAPEERKKPGHVPDTEMIFAGEKTYFRQEDR